VRALVGWFYGCALLVAVCLAACAGPRHVLPVRVEDPPVQEALVRSLHRRYPAQYRLVQRLALRTRGKQYDLVGYLVVSDAETLRALALGEMGGRLFDFSLERRVTIILKKPEGMPVRPLTLGVAEDLRHLFLPPPDLSLARRAGGSPALVGNGPGARAVEYAFDAGGRYLQMSVESEGGGVVRQASYADYRVLAAATEAVPTRIVLENRRWQYTLEIDALELIPGLSPSPNREE